MGDQYNTPSATLPATPADLFASLRLTEQRFRSLVDCYRRFTVPKRDGRPRYVAEPIQELKDAQRLALKQIWSQFRVHDAVHGYVRGRSAYTNALAHAGCNVLVAVDLRDFFPSFTVSRVEGWLCAAGANREVAHLLALLATVPHRRGPRTLVQGAPTSPAIANALSWRLDRRLAGLADSRAYKYTRYADDLTFSWHEPEPPDTDELVYSVTRIARSEGFSLSESRIMRASDRQEVTGFVINRARGAPAVRAPRETVRQLRAAAHRGDLTIHDAGQMAYASVDPRVRRMTVPQ